MNIAAARWRWGHGKQQQQDIRPDSSAKEHYNFCGGNTGNLVHLNSYEPVLKNHKVTHCNCSDINFINSQDLLLIKCANLLGPHHNPDSFIISQLEKINIPIIICCIGAQNKNFDNLDILSENTRWPEFFQIINSKRISDYPNISVRGKYTQKVLNFYGVESIVTGCISTLLFKDNLGTILKQKYTNKQVDNICVAGNNPYNYAAVWIEKQLQLITEKYNGIHIAQSPLEIFKLIHGEDVKIPDSFLKMYDMNHEEIKRWYMRYGKIFYNTDAWSSVMKLYDMVIGTRYHGVAMGLQSEILGTLFFIDSRTKELAMTSGIKHMDVNLLQNKNYKEILEMSLWNNEDYAYLNEQVNFSKNQFHLFFSNNKVIL
jgi:hypothetical protein